MIFSNFQHNSMITAIQPIPAAPVYNYYSLLPWIVASLIILVGIFIYGWSDLVRTHWQRIWAISGVCVTESLRRKVLWLTPAAMLGIVVVSQFQVADSPQDTIQQTTKFCLFASGLLVTVTAIILASTNLPREIESRVIFTVVTKPTTRLEIILGKVLGYARVSGMIILIMGLFTLVYLQVRARPIIADLKEKIKALPVGSPVRATDEYYVNSGLLGTRSLAWGSDFEVFAEPPAPGEKWSQGGVAQYFLVPFSLSMDERQILSAAAENEKGFPIFLTLALDIKRHEPTERERRDAKAEKLEEGDRDAGKPSRSFDIPLPSKATTMPEPAKPLVPYVQVRYLNSTLGLLVKMDLMNAGEEVKLKQEKPDDPTYSGASQLSADVLREAAKTGKFYVQVTPRTPAMEFGVKGWVATLAVPNMAPIKMAADPGNPSQAVAPIFGAYPTRDGVRLTPVREWGGPVAVFHFRNTEVTPDNNGNVGMQIGVAVDRTSEFKDDTDHPAGYARATLQVVNLTTGETSEAVTFSPETSRVEPVNVSAKYLKGGNFDVLLRSVTQGQNLGIPNSDSDRGAMALVTADRNFLFNLLKSLLILWLLSLLVVIIAIFCSTFVSWPIAIVLTLVILLSHWGVEQLGGALDRGTAGRTTAQQLGTRDPSTTQFIAGTVDFLSLGLRTVSACLPDVSQFPVVEDIESGVSIAPVKVAGALGVLFCYGLPMLVFSYVILRRKEVAP